MDETVTQPVPIASLCDGFVRLPLCRVRAIAGMLLCSSTTSPPFAVAPAAVPAFIVSLLKGSWIAGWL